MKIRRNISQVHANNGERYLTYNTVYFLRNEKEVLVEHVDKLTADLERLGYEVHYSYD